MRVGNKVKKARKERENKIKSLKDAELPELNDIKNQKIQKANDMKVLIQHIQTLTNEYKNLRQNESQDNKKVVLRTYIASQYEKMLEKFPNEMERCFPLPKLEVKGVSNRRVYSKEFKTYFLDVLRGNTAIKKGKFIKKDKVPFWIPSSKPCSSEKGFSLSELTTRSTNIKGRQAPQEPSISELTQFQLHPWNRKDNLIKEKLLQVMLTYSDAENCTFRPKIGNYTIEGKVNKAIDEIDPRELVEEMGENFQKKYPYVFKSGIYNKAMSLFQSGKYVEGLRKLKIGFNIDSLLRNFHPNYEEYKKQRRRKRLINDEGKVSIIEIDVTLDEKKHKAEEDAKNPKLLPILRDAYDLLMKIEKAFDEKERNVALLDKPKKTRGHSLNERNKPETEEVTKFKAMMCPLGILCPSNTNQNETTNKCSYAHHYSELHFEY